MPRQPTIKELIEILTIEQLEEVECGVEDHIANKTRPNSLEEGRWVDILNQIRFKIEMGRDDNE